MGRPPIPREHGAWVILFAPLVVGLAVSDRFEAIPALLLIVAVTAAFLARFAADLVLRRRASARWLVVYGGVLALSVAPLLAVYHRGSLVILGAGVAVLFGIHAALTARPTRKRFDRTAAGELLAVAALVSTGPAAVIVERGALDSTALTLWLICAHFFAGGVLHVNMFLEAAKVRGAFTREDRARVSRPSLHYHLFFCTAFPLACTLSLGLAGTTIAALGALPAVVRAFRGIATVSNTLPPLKRIGLLESASAAWFCACLIAAFLIR